MQSMQSANTVQFILQSYMELVNRRCMQFLVAFCYCL